MKGSEYFTVNGVAVALSLIVAFMFVAANWGMIEIHLTNSNQIGILQKNLAECTDKYLEKCPLCPEVRCVGDMSMSLFTTGLFFGFIGGALFITYFRKKIVEVVKEKAKVKK
jgi:hypothetical protein